MWYGILAWKIIMGVIGFSWDGEHCLETRDKVGSPDDLGRVLTLLGGKELSAASWQVVDGQE